MKKLSLLPLLALSIVACGGRYNRNQGGGTTGTPVTNTVRTVVEIGSTVDSALHFTNHVATFRTNAPTRILSDVVVTGLDTNDPVLSNGSDTTDELIAIDQRPATGNLYALSIEGTLYLLNPTTGVATKIATVAALHTLALGGSSISDIDFDPTNDQLRVCLSDFTTGISTNLRLNPDTGAVIATDTPFSRNGRPFALDSIAYSPTGSLFGVASSDQPNTLYEDFVKIPDPNSGAIHSFTTLSTIYFDGTFGLDISSDGVDADVEELFLVDVAAGVARSIGTPTPSFRPTNVAFLNPVQ